MRIPYFNLPCLVNETCFHGRCMRVDDVLLGWYEFCFCDHHFIGSECNEQTRLSHTDWLILLSGLLLCLGMGLCLLTVPFLYGFLKEDFYPQIIECARSTPYIEIKPSRHQAATGIRLYRIPSEHLSRRRTILDGLIPLHSISSLAYLTGLRRVPSPRMI